MKTTKIKKFGKLKRYVVTQAEPLEMQIRRMVSNGEDLEQNKSKPLIYTEKKEGVQSAYDIRADKWDIALEAVDKIQRSNTVKAKAEMKVIKNDDVDNNGNPDKTGVSQ